MAPTHHVYLVPGFFGFANLGRIAYFGHVRRALAEALARRNVEARIHVVRTPPTASLPRRAAKLAETIASTRGRRPGDPVHLVGHSSGGLDARLLTAPGTALPTRVSVERIAARVRSVVTIATPHRGTPIAAFFATLRGQRLLELLSLSTVHLLHLGEIPLAALLRVGGVLARLEELPTRSALLDEVFGRLLADFSPGRRRAVRKLLRDVSRDASLMLQLTPEAMELFAAAVPRRPGVRCASVVARAARPSLRTTLAEGLDPAGQVSRAVYGSLYRLAATTPRVFAPALEPAQARVLRRAFGREPGPEANDGIVPTRSQVWGRVLHAALADHLDVLGHFPDASTRPPHVDWLATGSGFDRAGFTALWGAVADLLAAP